MLELFKEAGVDFAHIDHDSSVGGHLSRITHQGNFPIRQFSIKHPPDVNWRLIRIECLF